MSKLKEVIEEVKKILKKDSRGLTIQELSDSIGVSRITVSMALMNLIGQGIIDVREIGNCKLHYIRSGAK
jgi:predicted transcriptional regulator